MKTVLIALLATLGSHCLADEKTSVEKVLGTGEHRLGEFKDPRHMISLYEWIEDGSDVEVVRPISNSILIICWMPDPNGKFETYQISGVEGYHTRELVESFLEQFYGLTRPKGARSHPTNVLIAGNGWGAGMQLKEKLKELSKEHSFTAFYAGGWAFRKAVLIAEPDYRLKRIRKAFEHSTDSEQDDAVQPATAVESKAEGNEEPKQESEGRSQ